MIKAKKADQTRIRYKGIVYNMYHSYPEKEDAYGTAKYLRTVAGGLHPFNYTKAIAVDLGEDALKGKYAARGRYAVFIAKGKDRKNRNREWIKSQLPV